MPEVRYFGRPGQKVPHRMNRMTSDYNSTTDDVLAGIDLTGKTAIVTGASGGLGEETARALAAHGASVTIAARDPDKLAVAARHIRETTGSEVETGVIELDKPASVGAFAGQWLAEHDKLHILINNAGVMGLPLTRTTEGWELHFATNHLGHFLLTNLLVPALKGGAPARVVSVSPSGHNVAAIDFDDVNFEMREYSEITSYCQSKTANIWFANELDRRFKDEGVRAFSLHPGRIRTDLARHLTEELWNELIQIVKTRSGGYVPTKTIPQGAATSCWAATSPDLDGYGGLYLVDCQIAQPGDNVDKNHASWAYDEEGAAKLWQLSNSLFGTDF